MSEFHEEIEYDLLTLPNPIDLLDFYRGTLSARRLWLILRRLPFTSQFWAALDPKQVAVSTWGPLEHIVSDLIDIYVSYKTDGKGEPYPRIKERLEKRDETESRHKKLLARYEAKQRARLAAAEGVVEGDAQQH